jgi:hypothetical protein
MHNTCILWYNLTSCKIYRGITKYIARISSGNSKFSNLNQGISVLNILKDQSFLLNVSEICACEQL